MSSCGSSGCSSDDVTETTPVAQVGYTLRKRTRETRCKMARMARFIEEDEDYWTDTEQKPTKRKNYVRISATKRERSRMHKLNSAYEKLRKVVPKLDNEDSNQTLSKIATLRLAIDYIGALTVCLGKSKKDENTESRETTDLQPGDDTDMLTKLIDSIIDEGGWF